MSLAPRVLAAAGLLAVPALLAIGSQTLTRPADIPLEERQIVTIDLAPAGVADSSAGNDPATSGPEPDTTTESSAPPPRAPSSPPSAPLPAPAPVPPADRGNPGLVEREVFDDDIDEDGDDGADLDEGAAGPDGED